jgi:hypothetical protein
MPTLYPIQNRGMKADVTTALQTLAATLDEGRPFDAPPVLLKVRGPASKPKRIEEDVRLDRLIGLVAPTACTVVGVIAPGWARPLPVANGEGTRQRIRTVVLVDRERQVAGRIRWQAGGVVDEAPDSGRILDCLYRALGLETDPPGVGTDVLFASIWLSAVIEQSRTSDSPLTWTEVEALHPVVQILAEASLPDRRGWLVEAARALAAACPWAEIRRLISAGDWEEDSISPPAAAWMDDGMVCRWLLGGRPGLADLADQAVVPLPPLVAARVRRTLRALSLAGYREVSTCTP